MSSSQVCSFEPEISVVIPLYDKRVEEEDCLESWCRSQSLSRERFEVIVTSNGSDRDAENRVEQFLAEPDRLVRHGGENMAGLYHLGAEESSGRWIYFTELHCVAEDRCLEELLHYLEKSDEAGACSFSYGDDTNTFSKTESILFDSMFSDFVKGGASRKVLLRGVAIDRDIYFECRGFVPRYNRLCDGLLGARIEEAGYKIGYASESKLLHYYSTSYFQFFGPVAEKATDEFRFRLENSADFCERAFGIPETWINRQNFIPKLAAQLWKPALQGAVAKTGTYSVKPRLLLIEDGIRWLMRSLLGGKIQLVTSFVDMVLKGSASIINRNRLEAHLRCYGPSYKTIERHYHLRFLDENKMPPRGLGVGRVEMDTTSNENLVGLYPPEHVDDVILRWSRPSAMMALSLAPGKHRILFEIFESRGSPGGWLIGFVFSDQRVEYQDVGPGKIVVEISVPEATEATKEDIGWLKWVTFPEREKGSRRPRLLGMPVKAVEIEAV